MTRSAPMSRWWWTTQPGWVVLPLRAFLGFTFLYAGFDKLLDPAFFDGDDPDSLRQQTRSLKDASPLEPILGFTESHATLFGYLICFGEISVGFAVLIGLLTRLAAAGGAMLSLSFLLTVSWETEPYYLGSDIAFLAAWTPLIIAGSGGVLSVDALLAARRDGTAERPERRNALYAGAGGVAGLLVAMALGARRSSSPTTGPSGAVLADLAAIPENGARKVTLPTTGKPAWVLRPRGDTARCVSAVCTHAGCTVNFVSIDAGFACPCHGSRYDTDGGVLNGPATKPLDPIDVTVDGGKVTLE